MSFDLLGRPAPLDAAEIATHERELSAEGEEGARRLAILRVLGLFDRPADPGCLRALREKPAIRGLTGPIVGLSKGQWKRAVERLAERGLLSKVGDRLDAHPLVREHFARQVREKSPGAWRAAHRRLFEHLRDATPHRPDTLEGLEPLFQAVAHGCHAGRYEEARAGIYQDRILRGTSFDGFFSTRKLGAYGADLGAVACFFDPPWSRVVPKLSEANRAWLFGMAAFDLRALGRLEEALPPMRAALELGIEQEDWISAARRAANLSELMLALGDVAEALWEGERSVDFGDWSREPVRGIETRSAFADALHQAGLRSQARTLFPEVERRQAEWQPRYPRLYSLHGFRYCDLLLAEAERAAGRGAAAEAERGPLSATLDEVELRAMEWFEWRVSGDSVLSIALDHLTLGRAALYRSILFGADRAPARAEIEQAVDGLRRGMPVEFLEKGLLTRAWLLFVEGNPAAARADLDEAQGIAERGPMPLYLADIALYRGRFFGDCEALAEARRLIEKHGYGRRTEELADAEAVLAGTAASE